GLVYSRQAEGQAWVGLDSLSVHQVDVKGRIGHHEVALADKSMLILVVGNGLGDLALQPMDGEVHLGDVDGIAVLLLAVKDDIPGRVPALVLDEMAGLHEHAARAAGGVKDGAMIGLDDVDDDLDQRGGREELTIVVGLLDGKLGEEVFVDAAKDIAGSL